MCPPGNDSFGFFVVDLLGLWSNSKPEYSHWSPIGCLPSTVLGETYVLFVRDLQWPIQWPQVWDCTGNKVPHTSPINGKQKLLNMISASHLGWAQRTHPDPKSPEEFLFEFLRHPKIQRRRRWATMISWMLLGRTDHSAWVEVLGTLGNFTSSVKMGDPSSSSVCWIDRFVGTASGTTSEMKVSQGRRRGIVVLMSRAPWRNELDRSKTERKRNTCGTEGPGSTLSHRW